MQIHCQERYDECVKYAESINDTTLKDCFDRLKQWEKNAAERGCPMEIHVGSDFEKKSFSFREQYENGRSGINGGILFHGVPGEADKSFAVCIDGRAYGWRIHT